MRTGRPIILKKCNRIHMSIRQMQEYYYLEWFFWHCGLSREEINNINAHYVIEKLRSVPKRFEMGTPVKVEWKSRAYRKVMEEKVKNGETIRPRWAIEHHVNPGKNTTKRRR